MKKIGLLGGTFNYAHNGHLYISTEALKRLQLNEVWWLICNHNPLKNHNDINSRLCYAKDFIGPFAKIKIISVDEFRTYNLILKLKAKFKEDKFIWMMGMDNLINFHAWDNANKINSLVPIVIFDRGTSLHKGIKSNFAIRNADKFSGNNFYNKDWFVLRIAKNNISSTSLGHKMV